MTQKPRVVAVFGSSRPRAGDRQYATARELGTALAEEGFVVCSGGYGGVMEAVSRGAKEAGGQTLGITAKFFQARANKWVDEEIRMNTWQDRLFELIKRGHGYVACPGGTGTLVELAVVWEMLNKGAMAKKPMVVLGNFWQPVIDRVREVELGHASAWCEQNEALVHCAALPLEAAEYLQTQFQKRKRERRSPEPSKPSLFQ
jgi:uncharacterized protein (TIGR00730 family)